MSQSTKESKPRVTKNSQRLYNLEEQERLYKKLGVSAMAKEKPENSQVEDSEELADNEGSEEDDNMELGEEAGGSGENKKTRRRSKDSHAISDSESEQDYEPEKKPKKKRKIKNQDQGVSPLQNKAKKIKLQKGEFIRKGKKSPLTTRARAKKGTVNLSQPGIRLPDQLMVSPEDSSVIEAHMNAYTKWLLDNNMLVSQQSLNQFANPQQTDKAMRPPDNPNVLLGSGQNQGSQSLPSVNVPKHILDFSTDESSNVDNSETEGKAPPIPLAGGNKTSLQQVPQGYGELFNVCEAEKQVAPDDDSLVGPEILEQMNLMIKNFLSRSRKAAKIEDLLQEFTRPKNTPFLKAPFIEDEIYSDLAPGPRHFDKNCRQLQGYIFAAITALAFSLEQLILTEKLHPK